MSFIDNYLKDHKLDPVPDSVKKNLDKLEKKIEAQIDNNPTEATFSDTVQKFGPKIADVVEKFSAHFKSMPAWSLKSAWNTFRFVLNIGVEVHQIVEDMKDDIITPDMSADEQRNAKVDFGQNLVYFIWLTVNPLQGRLSWIPFKKTIEKKLVFWLSGMALDFTVDLFMANNQLVEPFSVGPKKNKVKVIPKPLKGFA